MNIFKRLTLFCLELTFLLLPFSLPHPAWATEQNGLTTYSAKDFADYKQTPFTHVSWDSFVKEGFEAMDREDVTGSVEFLRKAANLGCQSPLVLFKLGLGYEALGSYYSALQYYDLAQEQFKKANADHRYARTFSENYARALYMMGQTDKALPLLESAAQTTEAGWVLQLLGTVYISESKHDKAIPIYERLLSLQNSGLKPQERVDVTLKLARIFANKNDKDNALRYYKNILQMDPAHEEAGQYVRSRDSSNSTGGMMQKMIEMIGK